MITNEEQILYWKLRETRRHILKFMQAMNQIWTETQDYEPYRQAHKSLCEIDTNLANLMRKNS